MNLTSLVFMVAIISPFYLTVARFFSGNAVLVIFNCRELLYVQKLRFHLMVTDLLFLVSQKHNMLVLKLIPF